MTRSVAIIGAGQIGLAAEYEFAFEGWDVTLYARTRPARGLSRRTTFVEYIVGEDRPPRADVVLDTIAFDESDIARYDPKEIDHLIVISSASVYCDARGRTLDEAAHKGFPEFDGAIGEENPRVSPGPATYSTRKVRMENKAQELFGDRATILRPCAIYGIDSRHPREWWFVKRLLDGRERIPLANQGLSCFHTTSVREIAQFAENAATLRWEGAFNLGAEAPPILLDIGQAIADILKIDTQFIPIKGFPEDSVGRSPWSVPKPFTVSISKALAFEDGYPALRCVGELYGGIPLENTIHWLAELNPADWRAAFPQLAAYPYDLFDYEAEDRFFASL
ncbi:MAG: reductase [Pseudomonadota bacterium]